ncbi:hypothetical protein TSH100_03710 [Azospirillum sp. TSH100]|uniref:hypothetical protein n=1 Tax=Azospirillum sp. TSH100 TaxID=652764 RepID=UPI000D61370F|nr:hypothetical protein [Azospirillum sp. TSH100]PWC90100.1 hypothetical protein TSH100_03710 [Azospirillum sp. TSH100]QCG90663.1 hypothetical protein E6C72_23030 [Azospirillum sp. TSH100]
MLDLLLPRHRPMVTAVRRIVGLGLLAAIATASAVCAPAMAQSAKLDSASPGRVLDEPVAIVRSGRTGDPAPPVVMARSDWEAFLAETRFARVRATVTATEDAEARLRTAIDETTAVMRAEIPAFVGWRFSFFTTYRLTFTAVSGVVSGTDPESAVKVAVAERFREMVLKPVMVRTRLTQAMDEVTLNATRQREAFIAERRIALDRLAQERGGASTGAPVAVMVSEADALGLPPMSSVRPALPVSDPNDEVGWLGQREALVMAGRQAARRGVGVVVEPTVLAVAPVSLAETAPFLISAAAGATVLGAGLAIELVALKLWESTEREALEEEAHSALNRYHQELSGIVSPMAGALIAGTLGTAQ